MSSLLTSDDTTTTKTRTATSRSSSKALLPWQLFESDSIPPDGMPELRRQVDAFVAAQLSAGRSIALVTSGGTTVPLERRTVRFIDNFSTGTRGARTVEQLRAQGYSVLHLARSGSCMPYSVGLTPDILMSMLRLNSACSGSKDTGSSSSGNNSSSSSSSTGNGSCGGGSICVDTLAAAAIGLRERLEARARAEEAGTALLTLAFTTVTEYMYMLRECACALDAAGRNALVMLAAAVSDFYVPRAALSEHKIQSRGGDAGLELRLTPTPKMVLPLARVWCREAYIVTFKLETDAALLVPKSLKALETYGHGLVIANLLTTRYTEVQLIASCGDTETVHAGDEHAQEEAAGGKGNLVEAPMVARVAARHADWVRS